MHRRERPELVPERIASVAMATGKDAIPPPLNVGEAGGHLLALRTKQTQLFAGELRVAARGGGCCSGRCCYWWVLLLIVVVVL